MKAFLVIHPNLDSPTLTDLFDLASSVLGINREIVKAVYLLSDPRTKEPFYVGTGSELRVRMRIRDKCKWNTVKLQKRIDAYTPLGLSAEVTLLALFDNAVSGNAGPAQYYERFFKQYYLEEEGAALCNENDKYRAIENISFDYLGGYDCKDHPLSDYKPVR